MIEMMVIGAGLSLLGANAAAGGVTKAGRYNKQIADRNAKVAEQKAELRLFRAEQDIVKFRSQYQTLAGQQEVQYNHCYDLSGIVIHHGSGMHYGHYWCLSKSNGPIGSSS